MLVCFALFNNCGYITAACGCNASAIWPHCAFRLSSKPDLFHCFACQRKSSMTSVSGLVVSSVLSPTLYKRVCFCLDAIVSISCDVECLSHFWAFVSRFIYPAHIKFGAHLSGSHYSSSVHIYPAHTVVSTLSAVFYNMQVRHICYCPRMPRLLWSSWSRWHLVVLYLSQSSFLSVRAGLPRAQHTDSIIPVPF